MRSDVADKTKFWDLWRSSLNGDFNYTIKKMNFIFLQVIFALMLNIQQRYEKEQVIVHFLVFCLLLN